MEWFKQPARIDEFRRCLIASAIASTLFVGSAFADTILVPDDYPTIQQAIDAASGGDEIVVSPGTYFENIDFLNKDIIVRSTDPFDHGIVETTIIDGSATDTVVLLSTGVIQGFTIRNGTAIYGGGVYAINVAEIRDNIITGNSATYGGAGIFADGDVVVDSNTIVANAVVDFYYSGGGVHAQTRTTITNNLIINNSNSGVFARHFCRILNNRIIGNRAGGGGGVRVEEFVAVRSNLIAGNQAELGGGIWADELFGEITGNTIVGNAASSNGSGIHANQAVIASNIIAFSPSDVEANFGTNPLPDSDYNCVFGNQGTESGGGPNDLLVDPQFVPGPTGSWTAPVVFDPATFTTLLTDDSASFVEDELLGMLLNPDTVFDLRFAIIANTATTMTVVGAPSGIFASKSYQIYDFHLSTKSPTSPCIGAGDPSLDVDVYRVEDIDGEWRVQDCLPDIGADETSGEPTFVVTVDSTIAAAAIQVSKPDCRGLADGAGRFNRLYIGARSIALEAEDRGMPFQWVINGVDQPMGNLAVVVELTDHAEAEARYLPVNNATHGTFYTRIQDAIDASTDGDEIIAFPNVYVERVDFLDKDILLRSADPLDPAIVASTIIDGNDDDTCVFISSGEISGFTIRNGHGNIGGGVWADGTAVVSHNVITENIALSRGGGINGRENAVIRNNTITNNMLTGTNDGGGASLQGNCQLIENVISGNQAQFGGGVLAKDDSIALRNVITDNTATNRGGGVYARDETQIRGNVIAHNVSQDNENGGGGVYAWITPIISDNVIIENTSLGPGGGVHIGFGADLINNTIVGNSCATLGAGIYATSLHQQFDIRQNIIAFNTGGAGVYTQEPIVNDYNCLFGHALGDYSGLAFPGPNDIFVDPLLGADFIHLLPASPCINAGDPNFVPAQGQTDVDGDPRIVDGRVDIGADEVATPGDLDGDGFVGAADLAILLGSWGPCRGCDADLNGDGFVNSADLAILLGNWG